MNESLHTTMVNRGLYGFQIINALDNMVEVLPADEMGDFRGPCLVVVNTSKSDTPGTHWVVICIDNQQRGEFIDSFGLHPVVYDLEDGIEHCTTWMYNNVILQNSNSTVCGYYAIAYCISKIYGISMVDFVSMFTIDTNWNDQFVCNLVYDYVYK